MILLDTHIWLWYLSGAGPLSAEKRRALDSAPKAVSAISCWETAKLVERNRLTLSMAVGDWIEKGLEPSGILLIPLEPAISVLSTQLPGAFHKDPADQIIVATSRYLDLRLATLDEKILAYPGVKLVWPR